MCVRSGKKMKLFFILFSLMGLILTHGVSSFDTDVVSVMEGDSVTLNTDVETNQTTFKWYFDSIRIAQINKYQIKLCTESHCKERFRERLKVDHQTGSLTITNTTITDSGEYTLKISSNDSDSEKIYRFTVHGVKQNETKRKSVMEGESVILESAGIKIPNNVTTWYFNNIVITKITGDQSQIFTDDQCRERFRDRLEVDHQTGSLTITNTTNTDSGEYQLQINNSRFSITRSFSVNITNVAGPGLSSADGPGIKTAVIPVSVILLLLVVAAAAVVTYCRYKSKQKGYNVPHTDPGQDNGGKELESGTKQHIEDDDETSLNQTETDNGMSPKRRKRKRTC